MFSLATPIERQAALAALTAYIEVLDGVRIQPVDSPAAGADIKIVNTIDPAQVFRAAAQEAPHAAQVFGTTLLDAANPEVRAAAQAFGTVTTPPTPFPYPTTEQAVATPLAPPAADLDVNGAAWNADIHSSTRTKNKDGTWRVKRNTGAKDETPPAPPVVTTPPAPPVAAVTPPAPPVAVVAPPAAPGAGPATFKELMMALNPLMSTGKIDFQAVASACQMNGVAALPALNANPSAIPAVWATIQGML